VKKCENTLRIDKIISQVWCTSFLGTQHTAEKHGNAVLNSMRL